LHINGVGEKVIGPLPGR